MSPMGCINAYLDSSAVLDLFPSPDTELAREKRRLLKLRVSQRRVSLTTSPMLFQELARHSASNWPRYRRILRHLQPLIRRRILLDGPLLMREEFRAHAPLTPAGRYADKTHIARSWRALSHREVLSDVVPLAREAADRYATEHEELRKRVSPRLAAVRPTVSLHVGLVTWWTRDGLAFVREAATESLDEMARELANVRFPAGYPVDQMPSFWHSFSYRFGRVILDIAETRKIRPSDYADPVHYSNAAYSDVLVTDDLSMHDVHTLLPWSAVRPMRLSTFVGRFLSESPGGADVLARCRSYATNSTEPAEVAVDL